MKFDVVIGNPPYSSGETIREETNRRKAGGKLARKFTELMLKLSSNYVLSICPVGQMHTVTEKLVVKGLYRVQSVKNYFPDVNLKQIAVYYFDNRQKRNLINEISQENYEYSLDNIFSLASTVPFPRRLLEPRLSNEPGRFKVFLTAGTVMYTNDENLISELNDVSRGSWRAVINHNGDSNKVSAISLAAPEDTILQGNSHYFLLPNRELFGELDSYLHSEEMNEYVRRTKLTATNSRAFMKTVPLPESFKQALAENFEYVARLEQLR